MNKKKTIILCVLVCIIAVFALTALTACNNNKNVTMENYNKIELGTLNSNQTAVIGGWTFDQVKELLGEPSANASQTLLGVTAVAYRWGSNFKYIAVTFYMDKAIGKTQLGIH